MGDNVLRDLRRDPPRERAARGDPTRTVHRERPQRQDRREEPKRTQRRDSESAHRAPAREPRREARIEHPRRDARPDPRRDPPRRDARPDPRRRHREETRREEPRRREEPKRRSPEPRRDNRGRAEPRRTAEDDYFHHAEGDRPIAYPPPRRGGYWDADADQYQEEEFLDTWEPSGLFDQVLDMLVDLGLRVLEVIAGASARAAGDEISYYFRSRRVLPRRRALRRRRRLR